MMLRTSSGILAEIVQHKHHEVAGLRAQSATFEQLAWEQAPHRRPFVKSLQERRPAIIAEVKKASPSKGLLQPDFDPGSIARHYERGGAACLSVLTDAPYFQGSLADLAVAREAVGLPALRKDFTIDPIQIFQAAAHGADAILLIAAILDLAQLRDFRELAGQLGLSALVEVHDKVELAKAADSGAALIGVNNRNLDTFEVSLDTSLRLSEHMPPGVLSVSESGIRTRVDIDLLTGAGFRAFLVGESLMKSADPAASLQALLSPA